jgi:hypothetical protein
MLRGVSTREGSTWRGLLVACALTLPGLGVSYADALDGILEVRSAYVNIDKGVFLLHARVEYPVGPSIREALQDVVRDVRSGDQSTFATIDEALEFLGKVDAWPILVEPQLDTGSNYTISVRAGVRRGHLSASLRAILFWTNDWVRVSEWYTWSLPV